MYYKKEDLIELKEMGITAKIYPDDYESFYQRCWQKEYDYIKHYHKDWNSPYCDSWIKSEEQLEQEATKWATEHVLRDVNDWYNADTLYIEYDNGKLICKKENVKNKLITKEYILKLVEKDKKLYKGFYGEFTLKMQELLKEQGIERCLNVYPTTYGIGVMIFWWHGNGYINKVKQILEAKGVEYYNEYSDARWVYRFKVSKKRENLAKIY